MADLTIPALAMAGRAYAAARERALLRSGDRRGPRANRAASAGSPSIASTKTVAKIVSGNDLAETFDSDIVELGDACRVSLAALITEEAGSELPPTSAPVGVWTLCFSYDRLEFFPIPTIDDTEVARRWAPHERDRESGRARRCRAPEAARVLHPRPVHAR
jgi:hypothetical protein